MKNEIYCTAPWNGITVRENGDVKTCCVGGEVLGNLNDQSIEDILRSPKITQIQDALSAGNNSVKNCQECVKQEKQTGLAAVRQHYLRYYPDIHPKLQLRNLDIRWNNSCNLGCIYCSPFFSSTWEDRLGRKPLRPVKDYQDDLERFILDHTEQVQEIMLVGGEPMLMKQNAKLFSVLPDDTKISIITNISYDIEKLPYIEHLLRRPRQNVIWSLSLENTHKQFEYVRNGAKWATVEKNLRYLSTHWPETVSIMMVYSMLSAFGIDQTLRCFRDIGIKKFSFQTYTGHAAFDMSRMPVDIRKAALVDLERALKEHIQAIHPEDRDLFAISNIDLVIDHLRSQSVVSVPVSKQQFYERIKWCDQWNTERFLDLWPEMIKLVDKHLI